MPAAAHADGGPADRTPDALLRATSAPVHRVGHPDRPDDLSTTEREAAALTENAARKAA
ncbi:hypothetical protein [Streptomyces sp. CB01881]|uniref:hypothetical protein n=1 Tax=Streptomyces sp. CB01881 TaxID=2078691 RepID=UPI00129CD1E6|nr:hypothetical protein [Streptomyces sp. CB01881]